MTTYAFSELHAQRRGEVDKDGNRQYVRMFQGVASNRYAGANGVIGAFISWSGIGIGTAYSVSAGGHTESDSGALCKKLTPQQRSDDRCAWEILVEYDTKYDVEPADESPVDRPAKIDWATLEETEVAEKDKDNKLVANSAGEPFDPPIELKKFGRIITIQKNKATFSDVTESGFSRKVNNNTFTIDGNAYPARTLRMAGPPVVRKEHERGVAYYALTYTLEYRPEGWWLTNILDQGYRHYNSGYITFTDLNGQPLGRQSLLDGTGSPLPTGADPVFVAFRFYEEVDFDTIGMI